MFKKIVMGGAVAGIVGPKLAFAEFSPPSVSTTEYVASVGVILTALGAIWGLRKVIKLMNRS